MNITDIETQIKYDYLFKALSKRLTFTDFKFPCNWTIWKMENIFLLYLGKSKDKYYFLNGDISKNKKYYFNLYNIILIFIPERIEYLKNKMNIINSPTLYNIFNKTNKDKEYNMSENKEDFEFNFVDYFNINELYLNSYFNINELYLN